MAVNPMQRKANNSFLLGILITLIVCGAIIGFLFIQLNKVKAEQKTIQETLVSYYKLKHDLKSGQDVTAEDVTEVVVTKDAVPEGAYAAKTVSKKDGKNIETKVGFPGGVKAKIELKAGTIITDTMVYELAPTTNDLRLQEYNMVVLPTQITTGDYVDIRIQFPSGQDYIIVPKKEVQIPEIAGVPSKSSIWVKMSEDEILTMSSAIVEAYRVPGAKLYATRYVEPGMQEVATPTYVANNEVIDLINRDPNVLADAKNQLLARYGAVINDLRPQIQNEINKIGEDADSNLETNIKQEMKDAEDERTQYLESLGGE